MTANAWFARCDLIAPRSRLGVVAAVVTWISVLVVCTTLGLVLSPRLRTAAGLGDRPDYVVGEAIDLPHELFALAPRTLVFFLRSSCAACVRHEQRLARLISSLDGHHVRAVMVTTNRRLEDEHELAARLGLNASQVVPTEPRLE